MTLIETRGHQMFPVLDAAQIETAKRFASSAARNFAPGELLYEVGSRHTPSWLVLAGAIHVVSRDGLHHEAAITRLGIGQFSGEVNQLAGRGTLTAGRAGPQGSVLGVDCCDAFLEFGRKDVKAAGIKNVTFLCEDVQSYPFKPEYDFCFSRFGTQFFENPVAGLRNMRKSLKPGGIMTMIVWRKLEDNPWSARRRMRS